MSARLQKLKKISDKVFDRLVFGGLFALYYVIFMKGSVNVMPDFQKRYVQWFPGHMAKTRRLIKESLNLVDGVVEIVDARIPASSSNPELGAMVKRKPKIVLLNKSDVAVLPPQAGGLIIIKSRA